MRLSALVLLAFSTGCLGAPFTTGPEMTDGTRVPSGDASPLAKLDPADDAGPGEGDSGNGTRVPSGDDAGDPPGTTDAGPTLPQEASSQPPEPFTCHGCVDAKGTCLSGADPGACGLGGGACLDCGGDALCSGAGQCVPLDPPADAGGEAAPFCNAAACPACTEGTTTCVAGACKCCLFGVCP